ncbi:MAG: HAMP domain-containing histidine kinase [Flavobacteriales bacterium]|nr:HAMP domain-containing histidine kinase [Flavobacteriales bacterium]
MPERSLTPADSGQAERLHTFAHDIKNRIGGLWEAFRLLREGPPEGMERNDLVEFAERGFFNAQRELEDLLDDLHVERGVTAERARFELRASLKEALRNEDFRLRKKEQSVNVSGPEHVHAAGDARWTTQILQALVSNASKFSPRGASITIDLESMDGRCQVRVTDQGCGLSKEDLAQVFRRYAILSSRSTDGEPQSRGTLGRARQWAEAQGGTLTASSQGAGQGSVFELTLPTEV